MTLEHFPALIPISLLLGAIVAAPLGVWKSTLTYPIALIACGISVIAAFTGFGLVVSEGPYRYFLGGWQPPIGIEYVIDSLSAFVVAIVVGVGFLIMVYSNRSTQKELPQKIVPFHSVALLYLAGLSGMVVTGDVFNLYVFLEIASLSSYALVSSGEKRAPVAAFRYLIIGTVGASFYLLGVGYLYFVTGSLNMKDLAEIIPQLQENRLVIIAITLMVIGISIKMALFPLHLWLPDAYTYASSVGSAYLAPIGTKVSAYVLIRMLYSIYPLEFVRDQFHLLTIIAWLSALGIVVGSILAFRQTNLKRMLAYSSVAQIGYIGLGIGLANLYGFVGAVLHILNHAVMKAALFLVSGNLAYRLETTEISSFDERLRTFMPWSAAVFMVAALSMIGIPPTAGFFSKWYLVLGCLKHNEWLFVVVIGLSTLLNVAYFFRILEKMYLRKQTEVEYSYPSVHHRLKEVPPSMLIPTLIFGILVILLGLMNAWIVNTVILTAVPKGF